MGLGLARNAAELADGSLKQNYRSEYIFKISLTLRVGSEKAPTSFSRSLPSTNSSSRPCSAACPFAFIAGVENELVVTKCADLVLVLNAAPTSRSTAAMPTLRDLEYLLHSTMQVSLSNSSNKQYQRHHLVSVSSIQLANPCSNIRLQQPPQIFSASACIVSAKREYSRTRPETFGDFRLPIGRTESPEINLNARKARICGLFSRLLELGGTQEWLARGGTDRTCNSLLSVEGDGFEMDRPEPALIRQIGIVLPEMVRRLWRKMRSPAPIESN